MPAPPKPEKDKSLEALADFRAKAEPHDAFLGLFAILARIQIEIDGGRVTPTTGALEALSHLYERDAAGELKLQEWNEKAAKLTSKMPLVLIPLGAFEALAQGWSRYMAAGPGVTIDRAMQFNKDRGQGISLAPKTINFTLRNFVLAQEVAFYRRMQSRKGRDLSIPQACEHIAAERGLDFSTVKEAYDSEKKYVKQIGELIGDEMETSY